MKNKRVHSTNSSAIRSSRTKLYVHKSLALMVDCIIPTFAVGGAILLGAVIMDYSVSVSGLLQMSLSLLMLFLRYRFLGTRRGRRDRQQGISPSPCLLASPLWATW